MVEKILNSKSLKFSIDTGFPGSSAPMFHLKENKIFIQYHEENCDVDGFYHDYSWFFNFGIINNSKYDLELDVFVNAYNNDFEGKEAVIFGSDHYLNEYKQLNCKSKTEGYKYYWFQIVIPKEKNLYLANTIPRNYHKTINNLIRKYSTYENVNLIKYGKTIQDLDLVCFFLKGRRKNLPNVLITSGYHPAEPDSFSTEAVLENLLIDKDPEGFLNYFNFYIIPFVNPDGFHLGKNSCNTAGINLYWDFRINDVKSAPESFYLFKLAKRILPVAYLDYHAYTQQLNKQPRSYIKPKFMYSGKKVKRLVDNIDNNLKRISNGKDNTGPISITQSTLSFILTKQFNTVAYAKFHTHLRYGLENMRELSIVYLNYILKPLIETNMASTQKILKKPYGSNPPNISIKAKILPILLPHYQKFKRIFKRVINR